MEIEDTSDEDRQEPASRKQYEKKGHPRVSKTKETGTEVNQEATSNSDTQPETPQTCCKLSNLPACCNLSTSCNKLVNFIKLQQAC